MIPDGWEFETGIAGPGQVAVLTIPAPKVGSTLRLVLTNFKAIWQNYQAAPSDAGLVTVVSGATTLLTRQVLLNGAGVNIVQELVVEEEVHKVGNIETSIVISFSGVNGASNYQQVIAKGYVL